MQIVFVFEQGVGANIAQKLESLGITVKGEKINEYDITLDDFCGMDKDESECNCLSTKNTSHISKVNLDVSAMLAYCSSVTNGSAEIYDFSVPVLSQQAAWERLRPTKPLLDNFFKGLYFIYYVCNFKKLKIFRENFILL